MDTTHPVAMSRLGPPGESPAFLSRAADTRRSCAAGAAPMPGRLAGCRGTGRSGTERLRRSVRAFFDAWHRLAWRRRSASLPGTRGGRYQRGSMHARHGTAAGPSPHARQVQAIALAVGLCVACGAPRMQRCDAHRRAASGRARLSARHRLGALRMLALRLRRCGLRQRATYRRARFERVHSCLIKQGPCFAGTRQHCRGGRLAHTRGGHHRNRRGAQRLALALRGAAAYRACRHRSRTFLRPVHRSHRGRRRPVRGLSRANRQDHCRAAHSQQQRTQGRMSHSQAPWRGNTWQAFPSRLRQYSARRRAARAAHRLLTDRCACVLACPRTGQLLSPSRDLTRQGRGPTIESERTLPGASQNAVASAAARLSRTGSPEMRTGAAPALTMRVRAMRRGRCEADSPPREEPLAGAAASLLAKSKRRCERATAGATASGTRRRCCRPGLSRSVAQCPPAGGGPGHASARTALRRCEPV